MTRLAIALGLVSLLAAAPVEAQVGQGCFIGRDATGGEARLFLVAERIGDYHEVTGRLVTAGNGEFRLKANGDSGTGRMFRRHEYEGGALFIAIEDFTWRSLTLAVDGFGRFPFRAIRC